MSAIAGTLVWIRFGKHGRQLAHQLGAFLVADVLRVHKWSDRGRRWTGQRMIFADEVHPDPVDQADPVVQRAIKAATPGRPVCHHEFHFPPVVRRAICDSERQAVHA